jgi:hypothetical protein
MKGEAQDDALECRGRARCNPFGGPGTDTCRPLRGDGFNAADVASGSAADPPGLDRPVRDLPFAATDLTAPIPGPGHERKLKTDCFAAWLSEIPPVGRRPMR